MKTFLAAIVAAALGFAPAAYAQFKKGMTSTQVESTIAAELKKPGATADSVAKAALAAGIDAGAITTALINSKVAGDVAIRAVIRAGGDAVAVINAALNAGVPAATVTAAAKAAGASASTVDNTVAQYQSQPGSTQTGQGSMSGPTTGTPQGGGGSASPSGRG